MISPKPITAPPLNQQAFAHVVAYSLACNFCRILALIDFIYILIRQHKHKTQFKSIFERYGITLRRIEYPRTKQIYYWCTTRETKQTIRAYHCHSILVLLIL
jgi:hypothetical protein